jgi:hypothetical protein
MLATQVGDAPFTIADTIAVRSVVALRAKIEMAWTYTELVGTFMTDHKTWQNKAIMEYPRHPMGQFCLPIPRHTAMAFCGGCTRPQPTGTGFVDMEHEGIERISGSNRS